MTAAAKTRMSVNEYLAWAQAHPGRYELSNGEVVAMSPEGAGHAAVKYAADRAARRHSRAPAALPYVAGWHDGAHRRNDRLRARRAGLLRREAWLLGRRGARTRHRRRGALALDPPDRRVRQARRLLP